MKKLEVGQCYGERWTLTRSIKSHVWHVTADDDTAGVLKAPRNNYNNTRERFRNEVEGIESLTGVSGVLPLIDRDHSNQPRWFVMPLADSLADYLASADFDVTVATFAQLAEVLAEMQNGPAPVAHRDIKPDNLFWFDNQPVFGDFGIAAWVNAAGLTAARERVGPQGFLAPEALRAATVTNWHAADVYSLARTLWVMAAPRQEWSDGKITTDYPPPGQIRDLKYSLKHFGGPPARELDLLVQEATSDMPSQRPTAAEFADELRSWLRQHPGQQPRPLPSGEARLLGYDDLKFVIRQHTEVAEAFLRLLLAELRAALGDIDLDDNVEVNVSPRGAQDEDGTLKSASIIADHGRGPEDEWDGSLVLRIQRPSADVRLIVGALIASPAEMDLVAELHHRQHGGPWTLVLIDDVQNLHPGRPSAAEQLRHLISRLADDPKISKADDTDWICDRIL
ncbi:serine/threonine protein kinase [Nocardia sp. NPDC051321]|uniref:serine/threonine protein kinase n=1 Tax=Nocardia sp. NPDC051321 TaxID=3364323 RepID=UPI00379A99BB